MKDIKTKQKVLSIKTKNVKENVNHFIKQQTIHTRMYKLQITLVKLLSKRL